MHARVITAHVRPHWIDEGTNAWVAAQGVVAINPSVRFMRHVDTNGARRQGSG